MKSQVVPSTSDVNVSRPGVTGVRPRRVATDGEPLGGRARRGTVIFRRVHWTDQGSVDASAADSVSISVAPSRAPSSPSGVRRRVDSRCCHGACLVRLDWTGWTIYDDWVSPH